MPPSAVRERLGNGIPVVVVRSPSRFCTISVVAVGGMTDVAPARPDTVDVVDEMLAAMKRPLLPRDESAFEDRFRALQMPYPSSTRFMDGVTFSASVPVEHFAEATDVLAALVLESSFEDRWFERSREQDARLLDNVPSDGARVAEQVLGRALFGSHVYGLLPTAAHTRAVTRAEVTALHARVFQASRMSVVVAGNVQAKDALAALESGFGKAAAGGTSVPLATVPPPPVGPTIIVVDRPGGSTAFIAAGFQGATAAANDGIAAQLAMNVAMNTVVGRGLRLRDELKLVPATAAFAWAWRSAGELGWNTRTATENVTSVLAEAERITHALATDGPTDDEVDVLRSWNETQEMGQFSTPLRIAGSYAAVFDLGLPDETLFSRPARVAAISASDVRAAAAKYLVRERMRVVVVGDLAALREPLTKLGWGPIEIRSPNGDVVRASDSLATSE